MTIESINVRFFALDEDTGMSMEIPHEQFESFEGEIEYERNTVFENGVRQICLTKSAPDLGIGECDLCGESCLQEEQIHTECGAAVGECCHDGLRAVSCDEQGETWYYVN